MSNFRDELVLLIAKNTAVRQSNAPDFILAEYIIDCLAAFDKAQKGRDTFQSLDKPQLLCESEESPKKVYNFKKKKIKQDLVPEPIVVVEEVVASPQMDDKTLKEILSKIPPKPPEPSSVANPLYATPTPGFSNPFKGTSWGR